MRDVLGAEGRNERRAILDLRRGIGESVATARQRSPSKIGESSSSESESSDSDSDVLFRGFVSEACSSVQVSMQPERSPEASILLL